MKEGERRVDWVWAIVGGVVMLIWKTIVVRELAPLYHCLSLLIRRVEMLL